MLQTVTTIPTPITSLYIINALPVTRLRQKAPYHEMTRGGHIFYVEIDGDATHNPQVIMSVVDMMDKV